MSPEIDWGKLLPELEGKKALQVFYPTLLNRFLVLDMGDDQLIPGRSAIVEIPEEFYWRVGNSVVNEIILRKPANREEIDAITQPYFAQISNALEGGLKEKSIDISGPDVVIALSFLLSLEETFSCAPFQYANLCFQDPEKPQFYQYLQELQSNLNELFRLEFLMLHRN